MNQTNQNNIVDVTIIVPVYNACDYLSKCLDSLINQTYKNIEIILVDDGSIDESETVINEYMNKDNRIKLIKQENSGALMARNNGTKIAKGKYCMYVDADDWIELDTVEKLLKRIEENEADIVKFRFCKEPTGEEQEKIVLEDTVYTETNKSKLMEILYTTDKLNNLANQIVKKELVPVNHSLLTKRLSQGEDFLINLAIFNNAKKIMLVNDIHYHYYSNPNSTTNTVDKARVINSIKDILTVQQLRNEYIDISNIDKETNEKIYLRDINSINNYIIKLLKCKNVSLKDMELLQDEMIETGFYNDIKQVKTNYIQNNNIIRKLMIKNLLKRKLRRNYKYKYIINLYSMLKKIK